MQEAEYCDHVAIMDSGQVLAQGSPAEVRARARTGALLEPSMEDAFIAIVEQARARLGAAGRAPAAAA
jgi:ABC-2 type transport system ATP-binding protein